MKITSIAAQGPDTESALDAIAAKYGQSPCRPDLAVILYDVSHDDVRIHARLRQLMPGTRFIGGTSSNGFLTDAGAFAAGSIGLLLLEDPAGRVGVAMAARGSDPAATAERLLHQALADAGCPGQIPEAIWTYQAPGTEEQVLAGLRRVLHDGCPVYGGSAADNDVSGQWRLMGSDGPGADAIAIAVLFPSAAIGHAYQGGCEPTGPSGQVTEIGAAPDLSGSREIISIDGRPAAVVYNEWLDGRLAGELGKDANILARTTLQPLAVILEQPHGDAYPVLIHPEAMTAQGHLRTFRNVRVGERVFAMKGNRQRMVDRAGSVASSARRRLQPGQPIDGALMIFCGGCSMAVGDGVNGVADSIRAALGAAPFLCAFTFGEQGAVGTSNQHGNLMISALAFGAHG